MHIAIIGAGAAGMMAAATIVESGTDAKVTLIDKNPGLGRKVIISGGGRCNVTTGIHDIRTLMTKYPRGAKFLRRAMHNFPPNQVYEWFEEHGVPLKTEKDLRVFPQSNDGHDIVGVFERLFAEYEVDLHLGDAATAVTPSADGFTISLKSGRELQADKLILATGGQAYRHTGSTGDGYTFAESCGHSITPLGPSLNSFVLEEEWARELSGVSFEEVGLKAVGAQTHEFAGPMLFTHKGMSGPAVFALSSLSAFEVFGKENPMRIELDFLPHKNESGLREELQQALNAHPKQQISKILKPFLPRSVRETLLQEAGIDTAKEAVHISKKDLHAIVQFLKHCTVHAVGRGAGDEFVTAGGVELSEMDANTMESRITPGLYIVGELLNVDAFTGGFNLQASWAAGRLAGESIIDTLQ